MCKLHSRVINKLIIKISNFSAHMLKLLKQWKRFLHQNNIMMTANHHSAKIIMKKYTQLNERYFVCHPHESSMHESDAVVICSMFNMIKCYCLHFLVLSIRITSILYALLHYRYSPYLLSFCSLLFFVCYKGRYFEQLELRFVSNVWF